MNIQERIELAMYKYFEAIEHGLGRSLNTYELEMAEEGFSDRVSISAMIYRFSYES
jgi:hypothetical protein